MEVLILSNEVKPCTVDFLIDSDGGDTRGEFGEPLV
jgi:hypothetical protein